MAKPYNIISKGRAYIEYDKRGNAYFMAKIFRNRPGGKKINEKFKLNDFLVFDNKNSADIIAKRFDAGMGLTYWDGIYIKLNKNNDALLWAHISW